MDSFGLIESRCSVGSCSSQMVEDEKLRAVLRAAHVAPTARSASSAPAGATTRRRGN